MRRLWPVVLPLMLSMNPALAATGRDSEIHLGSVAMDTPVVMHQRLRPLTDYLTLALGHPVTLRLSPGMKDAIAAVVEGDVELAYLTPVAYLRARERGNARLVVKTITEGKGSFRLVIVVRENSPIRRIEDLAGKSFAFGDPEAVLQKAVTVAAGMPLGRLGKTAFLGHYDNIARAVLRGFYDAGVLKDTAATKWRGRGLRILYASPELPPYNIVASSKLDQDSIDKVRQALLNLNSKNPAHRVIIKTLDDEYDGFAVTNDAEYDVVRRLIKPFDSAG